MQVAPVRPPRVLLTRGLSNVRDALDWLQREASPGEFALFASYATPHTPIRSVADALLVEPAGSGGEAWLAWLAATAERERIGLIWPQAWIKTLLSHPVAAKSLAAPIVLPCPDVATYELMHDKAACHAALVEHYPAIPTAWSTVARGASEVAAAIAECRDRGCAPCIKPLSGMFGSGFRLLERKGSALRRILTNDMYTLGEADLLAAIQADPHPPPLLVMEYLAGEERSIDVLAWQGAFVAGVVRHKVAEAAGRWQRVAPDPAAEEIARQMVVGYQLHGIVNVQTRERIRRDGSREACFLEVNLRMSGGIGMACAAGLNLPLWLLRLALGTAKISEVPPAPPSGRVAKFETAMALGEPATPW